MKKKIYIYEKQYYSKPEMVVKNYLKDYSLISKIKGNTISEKELETIKISLVDSLEKTAIPEINAYRTIGHKIKGLGNIKIFQLQ